MTIATTTNWEFNTSATANMVNGGGFNTANANFPTDGSWTSANTNAPVLTSASYSFVAGDVGQWVYSKTTTNPGFYKITSVATGAATVNATIGAAVVLNANTNRWSPSTVIGVDSSASVSSKTYGVDYSQTTTAVVNGITDFASVGASTTLTSVTAGFTRVMVGNIFHLTTTGTGAFGVVGWYEIAAYTNATTVTTDRTTNSGTALVAGTGYVGGALDLAGSLQSTFFSQIIGGNFVFIRNGSYALGTATTGSGAGSSTTAPSYIIGYNTVRGDTPSQANCPVIATGASPITLATAQFLSNLVVSGTGATVLTMGSNGNANNVKITNTSTTAGRIAFSTGTNSSCDNIEAVAQNGIAISLAAGSSINGGYCHDSNIGVNVGATGNQILTNSIIASSTTTAVNGSNGNSMMYGVNNTLYGTEAKTGSGYLLLNANIRWFLKNNIIYGFTTGVSQGTAQQAANVGNYNNFFNNTTDTALYTKDITDMAINPSFISAGQLTGTTATSSVSTLTDSGASFNGSITDNVDYLHVTASTGGSTGVFLIVSHTNTTLTVNNSLGSGTSITYNVPNKHNYAIGNTSLKGAAFPGIFPGGLTQGYNSPGAVEPNAASSGSTGFLIF